MAAVKVPNRLYTRLPYMFRKWLFARQPFKSNFGNIQRIYTRLPAGSAYVEMVIYTATGNQQKTLFTRQPCVHIKYLFTRQPLTCQIGCIHGCRICFQNGYLHGIHWRAISAIYMFAGVYFADREYLCQNGYFTRPPSKNQIGFFTLETHEKRQSCK